jgi:hypothetical protein
MDLVAEVCFIYHSRRKRILICSQGDVELMY